MNNAGIIKKEQKNINLKLKKKLLKIFLEKSKNKKKYIIGIIKNF
jgi:hypothetical protein